MQGVIDECLLCARKHVRQAMITFQEARKGHPEKWDTCLGHLAEAADAVSRMYPDFSIYLREEYLEYEKNLDYVISFDRIFEQFDILFQKEGLYFAGNN